MAAQSVRHYMQTAIVYVKSDLPHLSEIEPLIHRLGGTGFRLANVAIIFPYMTKTKINIDDKRYIDKYTIDDNVYQCIVVMYENDNRFATEVNIQ